MSISTALMIAAQEDCAGIRFVQPGGVSEQLSYRELYIRALLMLGSLQQQGVLVGNEVVIQTEDNQLLLCAFWACVLGGIIPVPLSPGIQTAQKLKVAKVCACLLHPFIVAEEQYIPAIRSVVDEQQVTNDRIIPFSKLSQSTHPAEPVVVADTTLAYIQFSSGSTGDPKGVQLTHQNLLSNVGDIIQSLAITQADTLLSWMPLTHDMGMIGFHLAGIVKNINIVAIPTAVFIRRPLLWMSKVTEHRATVLYAPNFGFHYFLSAYQKKQQYDWDLSCVRIIINGAEMLSVALCRQFTDSLLQYGLHERCVVAAYGLAEATLEVSAIPPGTNLQYYCLNRSGLNIGNTIELIDEGAAAAVTVVDVGYPVSSCRVRICNDQDLELPENTIGHIQIQGSSVTSGYYNNPEQTGRLFSNDHWLRTGDIGFMRHQRLVITGRAKNIIIINGQNYYPHDIEEAIIHAGWADFGKVAACAIRDEQEGQEQLVVFILDKSSKEQFASVANAVKEVVLSNIGIPVHEVVPVRKIPKTTSGKIQNYLLVQEYIGRNKSGPAPDTDVSPAISIGDASYGELEVVVLETVRALLGHPSLSPQSILPDQGLNSITALQLVNKLQLLTGVAVSPDLLFRYNTVQDLTEYIKTAGSSAASSYSWAILPPVQDTTLPQKMMWAEYQLNSNTAAWHLPLVYRITGAFDPAAFVTAVRALVHKYELLRTAFVLDGHELKREVHTYTDALVNIQQIDLRDTSNEASAIAALCHGLVHEPFELERPSQLRVRIITLPNATLVVLVIHHILIDGWSLAHLIAELSGLYSRLLNDLPLNIEQPQVHFDHYAAWQKAMTFSADLDAQRDYWLQELSDSPRPVGLSGRPAARQAGEVIAVRHITTIFPKEQMDHLQGLCKQFATTPFNILMALLGVLINRYVQRKDMVIGFDVSGRISEDMEQIIGYTLNTLCLRFSLDANMTFADVVLAVKEKLFKAFQHQLYPFEQLLNDKKIDQTQQGNGLFDILVLYQNFAGHDLDFQLPRCKVQKEPALAQHGYVDLMLEFNEKGNGLHLQVQYNECLYTAAEIERFTAHIQLLLATMAADASQDIATCNFLTEQERHCLFPQEKDLAEVKHIKLPVHQVLERNAVCMPDLVAVSAGSKQLTYKQLNEQANIVANALLSRGTIGPDTRIGFLVGRNEHILIAMLAILKAGAAYVAIDPALPPVRYSRMLADSGIVCLLVDDDNWEVVSDLFGEDLLLNIDDRLHFGGNRHNPVVRTAHHHLAYVIYTSGSTGEPKGVMIEHQSLASYVRYFIEYFDITRQDIFLQQSSLAFDTLIEEIFPALCTGAQVVIAANGGRDIDELLELIVRHRITIISCTPLVINELNNHISSRIASLRLVISGGDVLYPSHIDKLLRNVPVYNTYGPCEITVCATYKAVTDCRQAAIIGRPLRGYWIYILDEHRQMMPLGKTGEIYIEGGLARGYLNLPTLTAEKFIENPFNSNKRLYRSGDLGRVTENGDIEFMGRADYQVKIRGYRIEPAEVEKVICGFEQVKAAVVVPHSNNGQLVAFLIVADHFSINALREYTSAHLPVYMIPQRFEIVTKFPLTNTGKADRLALTALTNSLISAPGIPVAPANAQEKQLLDIIKNVLDTDSMGMTDNFFECGCNSIKATRIAGLIHKQLKYKIELRDLFIFPTAALLHERVRTTGMEEFQPIPVADTQLSYAMSPAQKRLWLIDKIETGAFAYNESVVYEMHGHIDPGMIQRIFALLSERHSVLRTTFIEVNDEPVQIVHQPGELEVEFIIDDDGSEDTTRAAQLLKQYTCRKFDLDKGPLYRVVLIRLSQHRAMLAVVMHHIITDDRSYDILMKEFTALYHYLKNNKVAFPARQPIQYVDYVEWLNARKDSADSYHQARYWQETLQGELPVLDIPADKQRPALKQNNGAAVHELIDQYTFASMQAFCKDHNISLFMLLLSATGVLLARYTSQYDMIIGTPLSGRDHPDLEEVTGFFINTVPLRLRFDATDTVAALMQKVKTICLDAYEHGRYPFDELVANLDVNRDLSRSALFDVLINLTTRINDSEVLELEDLLLTRYHRPSYSSKFDLAFYFEESKRGLSCIVEYDCDIYTQSRVSSMLTHFINLLRSFLANPQVEVGKSDLLLPAEKWQTLQQFNKPRQITPNCSVVDLFLQAVTQYGHQTAIISRGKEMTYDEINCQSDLMANHLIGDYAVQPNDRVCIAFDRAENIIISILAIWKAGAAYVPIDPGSPSERIAYMLNDTAARLLITDNLELANPLLAKGFTCYLLSCIRKANPFMAGGELINLPLPPADIAYVMYTSGSTGVPKGVEIYHRSVVNLLLSLQSAPGITAADTLLSVSNCTFDISVAEYFLPLISGARLILAAREQVMDTSVLKRLFEDVLPTYMQATPSLWKALIDTGWQGSQQLKAITCGEPLSGVLQKQLLMRTGRLWNMYGPTEATIFSTIKEVSEADEVITIGSAVRNTGLYILDSLLQPVPVGVFGELFLSGEGLAHGYLNQPALTAEKFIAPGPFIPERLYATGDLGRWLPDGTVELKGRKDNQVKLRGFRIEPGEIENAILRHAGVRSAVVCQQTGLSSENSLVAFIELMAHATAGEEELRAHLRQYVPAYMIPAAFVIVLEMPLNNSGKVDRKKLIAVNSSKLTPHEQQRKVVLPVNETQTLLMKMWQTLLDRNDFGITDSFFDIGGHSLMANKLVNLIYRDLGVTVKLSEIFSHSTVKDLDDLIARHEENMYDYIEIS
ncbi:MULTISPECIES: non-ribosomal peptide synthetase [Niastella]|uniref:Amino acid adenylation domain-containing protein n=1 Tax=Niastella soli TaxID=2821487 RepID=A0ABS3Z5W1_9BACT|nr:non-ribosomal peptide synthetase [Niastella soli]MBO9205533.1 amino acid adenylation domain-containing protein [Niastella soli]